MHQRVVTVHLLLDMLLMDKRAAPIRAGVFLSNFCDDNDSGVAPRHRSVDHKAGQQPQSQVTWSRSVYVEVPVACCLQIEKPKKLTLRNAAFTSTKGLPSATLDAPHVVQAFARITTRKEKDHDCG